MQYFSEEYFDALARSLSADEDWKKKAGTLTAKLTLTVTDRDSSFMLEIVEGAVSAKTVAADDPADFKFEGPYEVWGKIASGQLDFQTAVITGKMKFRGSLPKIMGIQPQMNRLTQIAKDIPAEM